MLKLINVSKKKTTEAFIREKNAQTFNRVQSKVIESTLCDYAQTRVTGNTQNLLDSRFSHGRTESEPSPPSAAEEQTTVWFFGTAPL